MDNNQNRTPLALIIAIVFIVISIAEGAIIINLLGKKENTKQQEDNSLVAVSPIITPLPTPTVSPTPSPLKIELNKKYSFSLNDKFGEIIGDFTYTLKDYEITKDVYVSGRKAKTTGDKSILVVRLEVINNNDKAVVINTRNYIRLSVNNQESWFAPEIHDDPLEVQSSATKIVSIGFPIKDSDANLRLQVGEPDGEKEVIELKNY
ncbi:MAG: hypothetical protein ACC618_04535 [Patescibacteria group bacterium]